MCDYGTLEGKLVLPPTYYSHRPISSSSLIILLLLIRILGKIAQTDDDQRLTRPTTDRRKPGVGRRVGTLVDAKLRIMREDAFSQVSSIN